MGRGYPDDWSSRRRKVYKRDNYQCQNCGRKGGPHGNNELHAHHIVPISDGGSHKKSNLKTLCKDCHDAIHHESKTAPDNTDIGSELITETEAFGYALIGTIVGVIVAAPLSWLFSVGFLETVLVIALLVVFLLVIARIFPIISEANSKDRPETKPDNLETLTPDYDELPDHFFNTDAGLRSSDDDAAPPNSIQLELSKLPDKYEDRDPDRVYCEDVLAANTTENGVVVVRETGEPRLATGVYISRAHGSDISLRAAEMDANGNSEMTDFDGAVFIKQEDNEPPLLSIYYPTAGLGDPDRVVGALVDITHDRERSEPILRELI